MQLNARREARRGTGKSNVIQEDPLVGLESDVPLTRALVEENRSMRFHLIMLVSTLCLQTIAIFWNMFSLWDPEEPDIWHNNWQTNTSKSIITFSCAMLVVIVVRIRLIDLR